MCKKLSRVAGLDERRAMIRREYEEARKLADILATIERKTQLDWLQFIDSARASLDMAEMVIQKAVHRGNPAEAEAALNRSHDSVTDAMDALRHALMWAEKNNLPITRKNLQHVRDFRARMAFFK